MMKYEFEELAGYEVSREDYDSIIEPMYMATNLTKQEFVQTISKKRFAVVKKETEKAVFAFESIVKWTAERHDQYTPKELMDTLDSYLKETCFTMSAASTAIMNLLLDEAFNDLVEDIK